MQGMGWTPGRRRMREIVRIVVGAILCILATGIWVCQWVPLSF